MLDEWICPVCNKVNAPWVEHCDCNKNTRNSNFSNETHYLDKNCRKHKWVLTGASTAGIHYRCAYCGDIKIIVFGENNNITEITYN